MDTALRPFPGDTPALPPLRQQLWALRPGLDGGVPAVHDFARGVAIWRLRGWALRPPGRSADS